MPSSSLALTWSLSTISGYGLYGLYILLQFLRRGGSRFVPTLEPGPIALPTLTHLRVAGTLALAQKIAEAMKANPHDPLILDHPVLYAVGNDCAGFPGQDRVRGTLNVGCAAIEHTRFSPHGREYVKNYDMLIAISRWNAAFLESLNAAPVHLCHQGIDTSLFAPGPRTGLWGDRFLIFSGGKFEFRKGQDIVAAAFKRFHARHPEALLVTCWQNRLPLDPAPFAAAGHCADLPALDPAHGLLVGPWLAAQGLPPGSFIDLPYTPNMLMPAVLRECDAALFPCRCEGGTNLVAMEAMACGVPTLVSYNTGQKDLVDLLGAQALRTQKPVATVPGQACTDDWGESDVEDILAWLEGVYTQSSTAKAHALEVAGRVKDWDWLSQNERLLSLALGPAPTAL